MAKRWRPLSKAKGADCRLQLGTPPEAPAPMRAFPAAGTLTSELVRGAARRTCRPVPLTAPPYFNARNVALLADLGGETGARARCGASRVVHTPSISPAFVFGGE